MSRLMRKPGAKKSRETVPLNADPSLGADLNPHTQTDSDSRGSWIRNTI